MIIWNLFSLLARLIVVSCLLSCTSVESVLSVSQNLTLPEPMDVSPHHHQAFLLEERLLKHFLLDGYVISKDGNSPTHLGDSLLWTMITATSLPCDKAKPLFNAVSESVNRHNGLLLRIDPLPSQFENDPTSRDMEVGFAFGMTFLYKNCSELREQIAQTWRLHINFIFSEANALAKEGQSTKVDITPTLRYLLTEVTYYILQDYDRPSVFDQFLLDTSTNLAALSRTISRKDPCYPVHLTTLIFLTLDSIGSSLGETNKLLFCKTTQGRGLALTDWYCKKPNVINFLNTFRTNQYEYKHQRCDYESPDAHPGMESPAVDFLIAYAAFGGKLTSNDSERSTQLTHH